MRTFPSTPGYGTGTSIRFHSHHLTAQISSFSACTRLSVHPRFLNTKWSAFPGRSLHLHRPAVDFGAP
jgi:hypothetical protein